MESPTAVGSATGLYLYCFFAGPPAVGPLQGIEGTYPPFVLSYRDVCALVSHVSLHEYNEPALHQRLEDLAWLTARVTRHEAIVRAVRGFHPVIPVTFGTLYLSPARVLQALQRHYQALRADALAARYACYGLPCEISGPWPPYNFCQAVATEKGTA